MAAGAALPALARAQGGGFAREPPATLRHPVPDLDDLPIILGVSEIPAGEVERLAQTGRGVYLLARPRFAAPDEEESAAHGDYRAGRLSLQ